MNAEIENLRSLFQKTFNDNPWHGPSLREVLEGISNVNALNRIEQTHSIIELVGHMTAWRTFVIKILEGGEDYKVEDDKNFPLTKDWAQAVNELYASQDKLMELLKTFPPSRLSDLVAQGYPYTFYTLLHGLIHHDVYHAGQISLIKKALVTTI
jgi:uncharacterized damage-inducible protein DinB